MPGVIVLGLQWGDEGKGKLIDLLSEHSYHVVRAQGGNNAGHSVKIKNKEYSFHLVPCGILHEHVHCYIGGGTVIDPAVLMKEIDQLESQGISFRSRLHISEFAHVIFPFHRLLDRLLEKQKGEKAIGTTGRGIGPCYMDRAARTGIRICELIRPDILKKKLHEVLNFKNQEIKELFKEEPLDEGQIYDEYCSYGEKLKPFVTKTEALIADALQKDEVVLFEGAHGSWLDVTYGTYPYVTSSSTLSANICLGAGIGPLMIDQVIGVMKAYITRVGNGPLPTQLSEDEMKLFPSHHEAREIGTTTGRKRRMGWFDVPCIKQAILWNGVDALAVTKLDILDALKQIKICVGYRHKNKTLNAPPAVIEDFEEITPIYEICEGWQSPTQSIKKFDELPANARKYLKRLEELCNVPISLVSVGPDRDQTIEVDEVVGS